MRAHRVLLLNLAILAGLSGPAFAAADCSPVSKALNALIRAPAYHTRLEATAGDRTVVVEQVVTADAIYVKDPRTERWHKMAVSSEQRRALAEQFTAKRPVHDCRQLGVATINGTPTKTYRYVQATPLPKGAELTDVDVTKTIYVGDRDGRIYRVDSTTGQRPVTMIVDYTHVSPPIP